MTLPSVDVAIALNGPVLVVGTGIHDVNDDITIDGAAVGCDVIVVGAIVGAVVVTQGVALLPGNAPSPINLVPFGLPDQLVQFRLASLRKA